MIRKATFACTLACTVAATATLALASGVAPAAEGARGSLHIGQGWATAPIGASKNGAVFLTLYNTGAQKAALVRAKAPGVKRVELHRTTMADGVMRMRPVERIDVPARGHAALRPGGLHVMLIGADDLSAGGDIELTLQFAEAESRTVVLPVRQAGTKPDWLRNQVLVPVHRITAQGTAARVGTLALRQHDEGLLAIPLLQDLQPGPHAMHVHENATCGAAETDGGMQAGGAAGGHFDPDDTARYAGPYSQGARGDLPNLLVEDNGSATIPVLAPRVQLSDVRGRSVMIHAGADRYGPRLPGADALAGASGAGDHGHSASDGHGKHGGMRMYCGVIPE